MNNNNSIVYKTTQKQDSDISLAQRVKHTWFSNHTHTSTIAFQCADTIQCHYIPIFADIRRLTLWSIQFSLTAHIIPTGENSTSIPTCFSVSPIEIQEFE